MEARIEYAAEGTSKGTPMDECVLAAMVKVPAWMIAIGAAALVIVIALVAARKVKR